MLDEWLIRLTEVVVPLINLIALAVIVAGTLEAVIGALATIVWRRRDGSIRAIWMHYSRWLVAGLTFQLAADIIETSAAPSWDDIGQLAAIAAIRTFLNFFLERDISEMDEKRREETTGPEITEPRSRP
ncbi:hypothetical protein VW23_024735 [Devosia insulae DS-56]|uniref:DUF1622 domain-containing protein n=1 Tax=Devosia insulae DS-56 TaxID=1116389 RepID=A0A1E5XLZ1_9HYPH|nr:DUF1622 domain-containing protein [Devosia insulae]OEO29633.1 hypothetical protein VW23_024735 [Devosia insulae DS-56]